jgi:hypothetical protein
MKLIITESKYKTVVFKLFDKFGGKIDGRLESLLNLEGNKGPLTYDEAYQYLIEWRGKKKSIELTKTLLLQNPHHIDNYGSYNFFFEVTDISNWKLNVEKPNVVVKIKVDDLGGNLNIGGDLMSLEDALDNDDYGFEVDDEVSWGITDYFKENITLQTGINVVFDRPKYKSRIFEF